MVDTLCFFLSSLPISVLRILDTGANRFYDRNHQLYDAALLTRCYTQHALRPFIDSETNHKRHFIKIPFINEGIEFIDLPSIFKNRSVTSSIPTYFQNCEPPIICYKYNKPIRNTVFNFNKQGYRYHKFRKTFSKFYRRHYELVSKFSVGLKTLLHQGLSEPEFYGDLVYKFKKIVGRADFSDQFRKIIVRYKRIGYNINIMRQSACLVLNPITVNYFASLFNCTPVGRASDSMRAPT